MLQNFAGHEQNSAHNQTPKLLLFLGLVILGSRGGGGFLGYYGDAVLHGVDGLLDLRNQSVRILGGQAHLLRGEGDGHLLHPGQSLKLLLDFRGAVGAVQPLQNIDPGGSHAGDPTLSGHQGHAVLNGIHHRLHFGQQRILIVGGDPELLGGEGHGGEGHLRHGTDFGLDLGGAVGAVDAFQDVDPLFQVLVGHFAGALGQAFAADVAVLRMVVAQGALAVGGVSRGLDVLYHKVGVGAGGHILLGFRFVVMVVATAAAVMVMVFVLVMMTAAAIVIMVMVVLMVMVVAAAAIIVIIVVMVVLLFLVVTTAVIVVIMVMVALLFLVVAAAAIIAIVVMVVLLFLVMTAAAVIMIVVVFMPMVVFVHNPTLLFALTFLRLSNCLIVMIVV